jgi:hypothetical protein
MKYAAVRPYADVLTRKRPRGIIEVAARELHVRRQVTFRRETSIRSSPIIA